MGCGQSKMVAIQPQRPDEYDAGLSGGVAVSGASAAGGKSRPYPSRAGVSAEDPVKGAAVGEGGVQAAHLVMARVMGTWEVADPSHLGLIDISCGLLQVLPPISCLPHTLRSVASPAPPPPFLFVYYVVKYTR